MENKWERFIEIEKLNIEEIINIMRKVNNSIKIVDYKLISRGQRNTNYRVNTLQRKFFLRICADKNLSKNEEVAFEILKEKISVPKLVLAFNQLIKNKEKRIIIYEYVDSISGDEYLEKNNSFSEKLLKNTAFILSELHNIKTLNQQEINSVPNLKECFELLIKNPILKKRMGMDLMKRLNTVTIKYKKEIDKKRENFLIHCDFKTSNLIIDKDEKIYITDWEYLGYGNRYIDIGLFFRYENFFTKKDREIFCKRYNENIKIQLDKNWIEIGTLCNIVSLMEMLSREEEAPKKNNDIKELIEKEIDFLVEK